MKKYTKQEIKAYAKSVREETGEDCSYDQAALLLEQQAAHDAEAEAGTGDKYEFGLPTGEPADPQPEVAAPTAKVQTLKVKQGIVSRGARQAWYELALRYDGKPVADMLADGTANPPSHYTARSKHVGDAHSAQGYLRGLVRRGWVTLV